MNRSLSVTRVHVAFHFCLPFDLISSVYIYVHVHIQSLPNHHQVSSVNVMTYVHWICERSIPIQGGAFVRAEAVQVVAQGGGVCCTKEHCVSSYITRHSAGVTAAFASLSAHCAAPKSSTHSLSLWLASRAGLGQAKRLPQRQQRQRQWPQWRHCICRPKRVLTVPSEGSRVFFRV